MYVHQHAKGEPNQFTDGTVTGTNVYTHSPIHKLYFDHKFMHFQLAYLSVYISLNHYIGANKNFTAYRHPLSTKIFNIH